MYLAHLKKKKPLNCLPLGPLEVRSFQKRGAPLDSQQCSCVSVCGRKKINEAGTGLAVEASRDCESKWQRRAVSARGSDTG